MTPNPPLLLALTGNELLEIADHFSIALTDCWMKEWPREAVAHRKPAQFAEVLAGRQTTPAGRRAVKQALRKSLPKYQLRQDAELFERAYGYVRQYH